MTGNRRILKFTLVVMSVMWGLQTDSRAADLNWQARFRARFERDGRVPGQLQNPALVATLRARLLFNMQRDYLSGTLELQDSRVLGAAYSGSGQTDMDSSRLGVHQVYLRIDEVFTPGWSLAVGRFELNLGNQRLFSPDNWTPTGRVFEGIRLQRQPGRYGTGEVFYLKIYEAAPAGQNDRYDTDINGFYLQPFSDRSRSRFLKVFDLYGYQEINRGSTERRIDRITYGTRLAAGAFFAGYELEGARQIGRVSKDRRGIEAWMAVANVDFDTRFLPVLKKISLGREYFSGDDTSTVTCEGFANPYGVEHLYHGYYDEIRNFATNTLPGLNETNLRLGLVFNPSLGVRLHLHRFQTGRQDRQHLGDELDVEFIRRFGGTGSLTVGYSFYWYGPGSDRSGRGEFGYTTLEFIL